MIYLLDVSTLLALLWEPHVHHERVIAWQNKPELAVCPITELGFVRISTQPTFGATVVVAKKMFRDWKQVKKPKFVPCDLELMDMKEPQAEIGPRISILRAWLQSMGCCWQHWIRT